MHTVADIHLQTGEFEVRAVVNNILAQGQSRLTTGDAGAPHTRIQVHQHLQLDSCRCCRLVEQCGTLDMVNHDADFRGMPCQLNHSVNFFGADHRRGNQNVVDAASQHDLCFTDGRRTDTQGT